MTDQARAEVIATDWDELAGLLRVTAFGMESSAKSLMKRAKRAAEQARIIRGEPEREPVEGKRIDRILWNHGRDTIDEIVVHDCTVHVEQMDDNCWWIGISKGESGEQMWSGNFSCPHYRSKTGMSFTEQDDDLEWDEEKEHQ